MFLQMFGVTDGGGHTVPARVQTSVAEGHLGSCGPYTGCAAVCPSKDPGISDGDIHVLRAPGIGREQHLGQAGTCTAWPTGAPLQSELAHRFLVVRFFSSC
uniref:Uncharacterized protein n=1 Tax=Arundo donax TaxID=35708 RepID=A0A0A9H9K8_ARUDO